VAGGQQHEHQLPLPHPVHRHVDVVAAARGVQAPGCVLAARADDQSFDVKEEIFAAAVERRAADVVLRDAVQRGAQRVRIGGGDDLRGRQHHEVGVVNLHQRRKEERLRVLEIVIEDVLHILRREAGGLVHHSCVTSDR